jgi:hypothetical protein
MLWMLWLVDRKETVPVVKVFEWRHWFRGRSHIDTVHCNESNIICFVFGTSGVEVGYPDRFFVLFPSPSKVNPGILPQIRPWPPCFMLFVSHHSLGVYIIGAVDCFVKECIKITCHRTRIVWCSFELWHSLSWVIVSQHFWATLGHWGHCVALEFGIWLPSETMLYPSRTKSSGTLL